MIRMTRPTRARAPPPGSCLGTEDQHFNDVLVIGSTLERPSLQRRDVVLAEEP